MQKAVEV